MAIILDNIFSRDSYGVRAERLHTIQANLPVIQPELNAPPEITGWASGCYDIFMQKWSGSETEHGESEGATLDVTLKEEKMEEEYQNCRSTGMAAYVDDPVNLEDFDFDTAYPQERYQCIARVENVLNVHARHQAEGIVHLIPDVLITRLTTAMTDFKAALEAQDVERAEAKHATTELTDLIEYDTKKLNSLKSWWFAVMGKEDARIDYIGMVNPRPRHGGSLPGVPADFTYNFDTGIFSWDAVETATSYQLAYRAAGSSDNWEQGYHGSETSSNFFPGAGNWEFCVRARNQHGYGDFTAPITAELDDTLLPPAWVYAHYSGAPAGPGRCPRPEGGTEQCGSDMGGIRTCRSL